MQTDLFLVILDGELESAEVHPLLEQTPLVNLILIGCVVENHFELSRVSRLSQQVLGEHLALLRQIVIIVPGRRK